MRSLLVSVLLGLAFSALTVDAQPPEDVVRRFLTLAYDGHFEDLPVAQTVRMERFERNVRNILRVRCVRVEQAILTVEPKNADQATVLADVAISKTDPVERPGWFAVDTVLLRFELVREDDHWFISDVQDRDEELAAELLGSSHDERERILRERPQRVTKGLVRAVYASAMSLFGSGNKTEGAAAAEFARQLAIAAGDRGGEALAVATVVPEPRRHLERSQEGLAIAETTGDVDVLARTWYERGRAIRESIGGSRRSGDVVECYQKAKKFAVRAENPITLLRILYSHANHSATTELDYVTARRYVDEAMPIALEVGDEASVMALETVLTAVYVDQGDRERALFHHQRALRMAERLKHPAYGTLLIRSADMLLADGQLDEAKTVLGRVLTQTETGLKPALGSVPGNLVAKAVRILASIEAQRGNLSEAECLFRDATRHAGMSPNYYLCELAPQYLERKDGAAAALALCLATLSNPGLGNASKVAALLSAGRSYRALGSVDLGLEAVLEAIGIQEDNDARVAGDEQQRAYAATAISEYYELAAELAVDDGDPLRALAFLERGRGRVLTDVIENGRPNSMIEMDAAVQQQQSALEREATRVSVALDRARSAKDEPAVEKWTAELERARAARGSFADGVSARSERRNASRREIDPESLKALVERLPAHTVAVEYKVGAREIHAFVMFRDATGEPRVVVRTIETGREVVESKVNTFLAMLSARNLRIATAGRDLYELLIQPIENEISGAEVLLVIPDEILWRVPFAALVDRKNRYLAEQTAFVYAPSLTAFAAIVESPRRRRSDTASLFAVGNPYLDTADRTAAASFYRSADLTPLPDAEDEVDALRILYDPKRALVLKHEQATEARATTAMRDAAVAHFATHAILDDANPMYSRLMLARDHHAQEDGWLEGWEIARLDLKADLVVLSACDTARGRIGGGEGVVGLSWSFFVAGARSTVATQWKVASTSTAQLMIAFHRALLTGPADSATRKARALREAQLRALRDPHTRHPFYWAAFVLLGDPS